MRSAAIVAVCGMLSAMVHAGEGWPRFRHVNYLAFEALAAQPVEIRLTSIRKGDYSDGLSYRVLGPKSEEVMAGQVGLGENSGVTFQPAEDGLHVLELVSGWNTVLAELSVPHAIVAHANVILKTIGSLERLYFYVPTGTKEFTICLQASVAGEGLAYRIEDQQGSVVSAGDDDYDKYEKIKVQVPQGADGKVWALVVSVPTKPGMILDDTEIYLGPELAPYLAEKPEWALQFGKRRHP